MGTESLNTLSGSWIVTRKSDGQVIGEFFNRSNVDKFNPDKVLIETSRDYLERINKDIAEAALLSNDSPSQSA